MLHNSHRLRGDNYKVLYLVYEALMSIHVAKKESSSKTCQPRGSSSVTKLKCTGTGIGFIQQYVFKKAGKSGDR